MIVSILAAALLGTVNRPDSGVAKEWVRTQHQIQLHGLPLKYTATAGFIPIKNDAGEDEAKVFFVAYTKNGSDPSRRPVMFGFNGGPGSASIWLHMGTMGPRRAVVNDDGTMPKPPFKVEDNQETWLGASDIVMIDAVGTGYSRLLKPDVAKRIYSVRGDAQAFAEFIRTYITQEKRWNSPMFIAGESYGGMRSGALSNELLQQGIALNGIVYISGTLNYATLSSYKGNDLPYELFLPTFAAVAFYHHRLPDRLQKDLAKTVAEVENWASGDYARALQQGDSLPDKDREQIATKLASYTGLDRKYVLLSNLRIRDDHFFKELLRGDGKIVGRLDGRFVGTDADLVGGSPEYDPSDAAIAPSFVSGLNDYLARELNFTSDLKYRPMGGDSNMQWDFGQGAPADTSGELRTAMTQNPHLKMMCAFGYFDMACPFFATRYTLNHMDLPRSITKNVTFEYYEGGHMMYIVRKAREKLAGDVTRFVKEASPNSE